MTHVTTTTQRISVFRDFFLKLQANFGVDGTRKDLFSMFNVDYTGKADATKPPPEDSFNLMFSDQTRSFYFPENNLNISNYYLYVSESMKTALAQMSFCPRAGVRWCLISPPEMSKCERMKMALDAKNVRPSLQCIEGGSTDQCIKLIAQGYVDLMTLEAADLYFAGLFENIMKVNRQVIRV